MNNKPPAFQFYAQDFLTGVLYLTNEEIGIYIKMLCKQWTDGKIPKKRLAFLVGLHWANFSEELKEKFEDQGDYLINLRLEKEREKQINNSKKNQENGKKGGRPKKTPPSEAQQNQEEKPNDNPNITQRLLKTKAKKSPSSEDEVEIEDEIEDEIVKPFEGENFKKQWEQWKIYKKEEFGFKYKSKQSEQAALNKLNQLAKNENQAISIIHQSMENGWKGFFKNKNNEQINQTGSIYSDDYKQRVLSRVVTEKN